MSLQSLNLDQNAISATFYRFAQEIGANGSGPRVTNQFDEYTLEIPEQKTALLQVFKKAGGTTTLHWKVGKNHPLSEQAAQYIAEHASRLPQIDNKPLTLADFQQETWVILREYLESIGCKIKDEVQQHGLRVRITGPQKDEVSLLRYNSGKFMMQGRRFDVYNHVASFLCEVHQDKQAILSAQLESVPVHTTLDELYAELHQHLPIAAPYLDDVGCAILAPALAQIKIAIELPDYSSIAFPALKGLEFYMKQLLVEKGCPVDPRHGLGVFFTSQRAVLPGYMAKINCCHTVNALEKAYTIHHTHRNSLFHADGVAPAMTRIIEKKAAAVDIVYDVLRTIESTYSAIVQPKPAAPQP